VKYRAIEYVLPSRTVSNEEILQRVHDDSESDLSPTELKRVLRLLRFAFRAMGTTVRYTRTESERPDRLCTEAGRRALTSADMDPKEVDLLIYVGVGRGFIEPATANVFQDQLGLSNATCFDVMDACASWLRAIHIARSFIDSGAYRNIMIINAEFNANFEDYRMRSVEEFDYRFPAYSIGEAATATIVSASEQDDSGVTEFRTFGDQRDKCLIPLPNWADYLGTPAADAATALEPMRFISYGRDIMEFGLNRIVEQYHKNPAFHDYDPDIVFFHAASDGMGRDGMRQCDLEESIGYFSHHQFANTVSAAVPLAMAAAAEQGRLRPGMKVFVAVASAGISTGLSRFTYLT
jgi:3-oxoacyl-[acyl-carrier-protein] synthase III